MNTPNTTLDSAALARKAAYVSDLMKMLTNPNRLLILCHLVDGKLAVGELAERTGMRPSAMSQQLAILRHEEVVGTQRDGQTIYYTLIREDVRKLMTALYTLYCQD